MIQRIQSVFLFLASMGFVSLFKLPFLGKGKDDRDLFPANNVAHGIFRNFLSRTENKSGEEVDDARLYLESEFESLQQLLKKASPQDRYDIIQRSLRRMDKDLSDF